MTLKNIFVFPALRLSGKEAGRHRHRVALSVGEAGTPSGSQRGAQVSTCRARAGEAGPPHCLCGVTVLPLHQHPGTAGKGCFLSRESQAECQLIRNSFAASWSPERAGRGGVGVLATLGGGTACELSSFSR